MTKNQGIVMFKTFLRIVFKLLFRVEVSGDKSAFINPRTLNRLPERITQRTCTNFICG